MNNILFFSIANHKLTVVGTDAAYTKPLTTDYVTISPGQTLDVTLQTNQPPDRYYMAAKAYSNGGTTVPFNNTTTTAILNYYENSIPSSPPCLPNLPSYNDAYASVNFSGSLRSLASGAHPISVPLNVTTRLISTISINTFPCPKHTTTTSCEGPNGTQLAASMNNISFVSPSIDILQAYYNNVEGVFGNQFPDVPPLIFNFTTDYPPLIFETPVRGTQVKVLEYGSTVEMVFQGTNLVAGLDHPMHLHGHNFYVVGWGFGNFDNKTDPQRYNLVDPPLRSTIAVPKNGWTAIRFKAKNPGVWFMHCHLERHLTWGMEMVFIVKNGKQCDETLLPPPLDMPPC